MARSLANIINKGISAFPAALSTSSKSLYQSIIGFSTHVPNDPDTHQNILPSNKVENSEPTMTDVEKELYKIYIESRDAIECRKRPVGALIDIEREKNERTIAISAPLRYAKLKARLVELSKLKKQRTDELEEIILQEKKSMRQVAIENSGLTVKEFVEKELCKIYIGSRDASEVREQPTVEWSEQSMRPNQVWIAVKEFVEKEVKKIPVMLYMEGTPQSPSCVHSKLAALLLGSYKVNYEYRNVLEHRQLNQAVIDISGCPTFPQVFIMGEFIGGGGIVTKMHQSGELKKILTDPKFISHFNKYLYGQETPF